MLLGYTHQGDLGIRGREAFLAPASKPAHHLYVCPVDGAELRRHRVFRDYLRAHPAVANKYAALKRDALKRFPLDRTAYTAAKSDFVEEVLRSSSAAAKSPPTEHPKRWKNMITDTPKNMSDYPIAVHEEFAVIIKEGGAG